METINNNEILNLKGLYFKNLKVIKTINAFETLTEKPPMLTIWKDISVIEYEDENWEIKTAYAWTLFNPWHLPKTATIWLAISQVLAWVTLDENWEALRKKGRTPMVTQIKTIRLTENADEKTPWKESFQILIPKEEETKTNWAKLLFNWDEMAEVSLEMQWLSPQILEKVWKKRRLNIPKGEKGNYQDSAIEKLTSSWDKKRWKLYIPWFWDDYALEDHTVISENERIWVMKVSEEVFQGHFPNHPIIPLAWTALPWFSIALDWFNESHKWELFDISTFEDVTVHEAVLPWDVMSISIKKLEENIFWMEIYFVNKDWELNKALTVGKMVIEKADRLKNLWEDEKVADAFAFQNTIPEYQDDQLEIFREVVRKTVKELFESEWTLKIADIWTWVAANISRIALEEIWKLWKKTTELTITDVDKSVTIKAKENILKEFPDLEIKEFSSQEAWEVVPEIWEQDLIVSNFSMNYWDIDHTIKRLSESTKIWSQIILWLVNPHPKYYKLMNAVAQRMNEAENWDLYNEYLIMKEAWNAMDYFDILGLNETCDYIEPKNIKEKLENAWFEIDEIIEDTFHWIGHIIKAKRK